MYSADDGNTEVFYFKNATATFSSFTHEPEVVRFYCKAWSTGIYSKWRKADSYERVHDVQWTSALHRPKRRVDHPVFIAQHATATCCRECIQKWHKMQPGRELSQVQQDYLVDVIMTWIEKEMEIRWFLWRMNSLKKQHSIGIIRNRFQFRKTN